LNKILDAEIEKKFLRTCYKYRIAALVEDLNEQFKAEIDDEKISELISRITKPNDGYSRHFG